MQDYLRLGRAMQNQFYVSHSGEQQGPFTVSEIVNKIQSKQLDLNDYCYDQSKEDWVLIAQHEAFAAALKSFAPAAPITKPPTPAITVTEKSSPTTEWYVLKGQNKFGPFSYQDVIRMLQEKSVFEFDYVWHSGLATWQRIAELEDYSSKKIRDLKLSTDETSEVFFRRRHARVGFISTIIIHDNKHVWKGQSLEVSAGGAGLVIENALLQPGQTLYLHFKPADGLPPFNAVCEVVSKQYVKGVKNKEAPIRYGVKFTSINSTAQKQLTDFAAKKTDRAA